MVKLRRLKSRLNLPKIETLRSSYRYLSENMKKKYKCAEYEAIIKLYNSFLLNYIIYSGERFILPYNLGTFQMINKGHIDDQKYPRIDLGLFRETGIKAPIKNYHSDRNVVKFTWSKHTADYKNFWWKAAINFKTSVVLRKYVVNAMKNSMAIYKYERAKL